MNVSKKAFTLVELLVVITILSILGTISFLFFESNIASSRDAAREIDLGQMVWVLENYHTENAIFPEPTWGVNITYSGSAVAWTQWTFWDSVTREVKVFGSDTPADPKFKNEYTYSVTGLKNEFQLAAVKETFEEEEGLWELALISQADASSIETAYVRWNYNGFMVRTYTWSENYFIATPSIIATDITTSQNVVDIITGQDLIYDEFFNLPSSYSGFLDLDGWFNFNVLDPVIFSGALSDLRSEAELLAFNERLKYVYATTPTESFEKYVSLLEEDGLTKLKEFMSKKFKVHFRFYFNCKDILDDGLAEGDGLYTIDPDGDWGEDPYDVYCDMTTDGGWWTRVEWNYITNGDFSSGTWVVGAYEYTSEVNDIVSLGYAVDGNTYALHQTWNYSSYYRVSIPDINALKPWYDLRMTLWRSDYGSGATDSWSNLVTLMGWKDTPWTLGTCTSGSSCYFRNFNTKLANSSNFWTWGALTDIEVNVKDPVWTVTTNYLEWGVLFDGYIPSENYVSSYGWIYPYTTSEIEAIDEWVQAGWFLISTNNEDTWDPIGEYYNMPTIEYWDWEDVVWNVQNVDHPLVNGSIWLWVDLRGQTLYGTYAHAALWWTVLADDIVLARDNFAPYAPTVLLRRHGKWYILFVSDDWMFVQMNSGWNFDPNDFETVFAAAIMAFGIETAAGINPHEWYVFHNRIHYNDGTYSTNGEDTILETVTIDDGWTPRIWTKEQTRHTIYKTPESFDWYIGLDANNNKDLYFTWLEIELFYR